MMHAISRFTYLFVFLFVLATTGFANRIDSLQTDHEVLSFLKSLNPDFRNTKLKEIELRDQQTLRKDLACGGVAEAWQLKTWEKTDLDGNGLTDLLVILYWYDYGVYAVLDKAD